MKPLSRKEIDRVERLVIHAPNWLGDTIMALPLVDALCTERPDVSITVVARPMLAYLWKSHPGVSQVLTFDRFEKSNRLRNTFTFMRRLRSSACDAAIILPVGFEFALFYLLAGIRLRIAYAHAGRGPLLTHPLPVHATFRARHLADSYAAIAGVFGVTTRPVHGTRIPRTLAGGDTNAASKFELPTHRPLVCFHVWSSYGPTKRWPPERFAGLADRLTASYGVQVILIGDEEARESSGEVNRLMKAPGLNLCGKTSLPELMEVMATASLLISTDSGPAHLAAALGIPVLTMFGSSSPHWTRPLGDNARVIYRALECSPCFCRECPLGTYACFHEIGIDEVWKGAVELLNANHSDTGRRAVMTIDGPVPVPAESRR